MSNEFSILDVMGPYREPYERAFSYDYVVQRPHWPAPQSVRVKVSIDHELDYLKSQILGLTGGTPGQQLRVNQMLCRAIADQKLEIGNREGLFSERRDVMIDPFTEALKYLFPALDDWMRTHRDRLREEINKTIGI
ncbi:MAG: hypothetical protein D6690_09015 [Nitrospirae bacterium]|nr:MAG: hypothetical protein D6690_09015 [Nitrospirota bacterium]